MQTVSNGHVVEERGIEVFERVSQCRRPQVSKIEALGVLRAMFNGDNTYDNQTEENTMKSDNYL